MLRTIINEYLIASIAIIFALGYMANIVVNWHEVKEFIRKGERHTLEHAVQDCEYINEIATKINFDTRNCEELYK